jgi:hypothetical protein
MIVNGLFSVFATENCFSLVWMLGIWAQLLQENEIQIFLFAACEEG